MSVELEQRFAQKCIQPENAAMWGSMVPISAVLKSRPATRRIKCRDQRDSPSLQEVRICVHPRRCLENSSALCQARRFWSLPSHNPGTPLIGLPVSSYLRTQPLWVRALRSCIPLNLSRWRSHAFDDVRWCFFTRETQAAISARLVAESVFEIVMGYRGAPRHRLFYSLLTLPECLRRGLLRMGFPLQLSLIHR